MSDCFLGEIRIFPYAQIPKGWLPCQGQVLQITQNQALYSLLSISYGGDGKTTFKLPDLRGRVPLGIAPNFPWAAAGGEEAHTLTINEMPQHTHTVAASKQPASAPSPAASLWSAMPDAYAAQPDVEMAAYATTVAGASQPHPNMQPYLTLCLCIATTGIYPPRQ